MGLKDITPGTKRAKAQAARMIKSAAGTLGIEVMFLFEEKDGSHQYLGWTGWLSEKAQDFTMKTLVEVMEFNGSEEVDAEGNFTDKKVINFEKEYELVVDIQPNEKGDKEYPRIQWVNNIGGGLKFEGVAPTAVKSELEKVGFRAAFMKAKAASGAGKPGSVPPKMDTSKDIPF